MPWRSTCNASSRKPLDPWTTIGLYMHTQSHAIDHKMSKSCNFFTHHSFTCPPVDAFSCGDIQHKSKLDKLCSCPAAFSRSKDSAGIHPCSATFPKNNFSVKWERNLNAKILSYFGCCFVLNFRVLPALPETRDACLQRLEMRDRGHCNATVTLDHMTSLHFLVWLLLTYCWPQFLLGISLEFLP